MNQGRDTLAEKGVTNDSMRALSKVKGMYQSTVPVMLKAKEISDNEKLMISDGTAKGNIYGFEARNAEDVYKDKLSPQDMSRVVNKNEMSDRYAHIISNLQRLPPD